MAPADLDQGREAPSAEHGRLTPQAVISSLSQMEARAAKASDETLTSAVTTGRRALAEWQELAGRLHELEGEYERLALSESRAMGRLRDILELLAPPHPGRLPPDVLAVSMLGSFELMIDGAAGRPLAGAASPVADAVPGRPPSSPRTVP